ncbi:unnamed protein product [Allacma fusca]|uniref:Peptidase S1 domain-containing protein n=1 Tax=Allacma fusca TaxID=39272 RepID=A0A8J2NPY0_9HEXA|nr:unnamed protein product [Allacma fusca]
MSGSNMRTTFNSRLIKCKDYIKMRSRYRKLKTSVSDFETRLTTLDQTQESMVERCNRRMKRLSTKIKGLREELQSCNNRIKILEQKLLLTSVHIEPIQEGYTGVTETGRSSNVLQKMFSLLIILLGAQKNETSATKISARMASSLCKQFQTYLKDCILPPPRKRPDPELPKLCGEVKWEPCGSGNKNCKPFTTIKACDGNNNNPPTKPKPPGDSGMRHKRVPVEGNTYPSVVGLVMSIRNVDDYLKRDIFYGHGFFINPSTLLTTGVLAKKIDPKGDLYEHKIVCGETSRSKFQEELKLERTTVHPKFNEEKMEYNFGLLHLEKPADFNDKVRNISLAQPGQTCKSQSKYASWTKMQIGGGHYWDYHDQLHEVTSVNMLPEPQRQNVKCQSSEFCTNPLLCGLWDQGSPLICSEDGKEYAYAISSGYFIDFTVCGEICGGHSTFVSINDALDWIKESTQGG